MKHFCQHCAKEYTPKKTFDAGTFAKTKIIIPVGIHGCKESKEYLAARKRVAAR